LRPILRDAAHCAAPQDDVSACVYAFLHPAPFGDVQRAVALDFRSESRSTYSLKPCIAAPLAPKRFQNRERANTLPAQTVRAMETRMPGNRNILYLIIGALIVAVGVLGYNLYQVKKEPEGLQINVGPSGLKIQNK